MELPLIKIQKIKDMVSTNQQTFVIAPGASGYSA